MPAPRFNRRNPFRPRPRQPLLSRPLLANETVEQMAAAPAELIEKLPRFGAPKVANDE